MRGARLDALLERLADIGALSADDEETRLRRCLIAIVILPVSFTWATLYLAFGAWTGRVTVAYAAISIGSIGFFARTRSWPSA